MNLLGGCVVIYCSLVCVFGEDLGNCDGQTDGLRTNWTGMIETSQFGEKAYKNDQWCKWTVQVSRGNVIHVHFLFFVLEPGIMSLHETVQCWDLLQIFDGPDVTAASIGIFCGQRIRNDIISSGNSLTFMFESGHENGYPGFQLLYTGISSGVIHDVSMKLNKTGVVDVPRVHGATVSSDYVIMTNKNSYVILTMRTTHIPCHTTVIDVREELLAGNHTAVLILPTCSSRHHLLGFISSQHHVRIVFHESTDTGFSFSYSSALLPCLFHLCDINKTCINVPIEGRLVHQAKCVCPAGYGGHECSEDIDECEGNPCGDHGTACTQGIGYFNCSCEDGYSGDFCEKDIDECISSPCYHGNCVNLSGHFKCNCQAGYKGHLCNEIDENVLQETKTEKNSLHEAETLKIDMELQTDTNYMKEFVTEQTGTEYVHIAEENVKKCLEETDRVPGSGIRWRVTHLGKEDVQPCPVPLKGYAYRRCEMLSESITSAYWGRPDLSNCTSEAFEVLSQQISQFALENATEDQVYQILESVENLTLSKNEGNLPSAQQYTGDLLITANAINVIVAAIQVFDFLDVHLITEVVSDVLDVVIDPVQKVSWDSVGSNVNTREVAADMFNTMEVLARSLIQVESSHTSQRAELTEIKLTRNNFEVDIILFPSNISDEEALLLGEEAARSLASGSSFINLPPGIMQAKDNDFVAIYWARFSSMAEVLFAPSVSELYSDDSDFVNSDVQSLVVIGVDEDLLQNLSQPIEAVFKHHSPLLSLQPQCVFLNMKEKFSSGAVWNNSGCFMHSTNATYTICHCYHLTNFAVIMDIHDAVRYLPEGHKRALSILSLVGGALSISGCVLSIILFEFFRLKSDRIRIHEHLAFSIAASQALFLFGVTRTEIAWLCKTVAVALHYFLEAMFVWMLLEGVNLYMALVKVFSTTSYLKKYIVFGWGIPAVMVAVSVGIFHENYASADLCWMTSHMIMMVFMPTVIVVIVLNMIVLITVLHVLLDSMSAKFKSTAEEDAITKVRLGLKASIVLLPLLGLTWIFGFISIGSSTLTFTYIFAITSSLQGFFFFIAHCLLNLEVRKAFYRRFKIGTTSTLTRTSQATAMPKKGPSHQNVSFFMRHHYKSPGDMNLFKPCYEDCNFIPYDQNANLASATKPREKNLIMLEDSDGELRW